MADATLILALDQGTTSSRAILFDRSGLPIRSAQIETRQSFPQPGWVNQDAEEIWRTTLAAGNEVMDAAAIDASRIAAIGIANQRETTIIWDRATGQPLAPAIGWQSRQSAPYVTAIADRGMTDIYQAKSGLVPDAYFSATKLAWLLDGDRELRRRAEGGEILFGTVDSWLHWKLSGGSAHLTDPSNAARTMLYDIHSQQWSDQLLADLAIPGSMLPTVIENAGSILTAVPEHFGAEIPVMGVAGDQQAALFGQACFHPGRAKNTYGTGSFLLLHTGTEPKPSAHHLLTTIAWRIDGITEYALEGAIFVTGAAVQWLRDGLGIISTADEIEPLASSVPNSGGVYFVPALTGLGSPDWDPDARGTILGLTRGSTRAHLARATLDAVAFQSRDVLQAMTRDAGIELTELRVDGGAAKNDLLLQLQADLLGVPVVRPRVIETTALGAAYLAGIAAGVWQSRDDVARQWQAERRFEPAISADERDTRHAYWRRAVERSFDWAR